MATSFIGGSSLDRLEGERDDLAAIVVGGERHHGQLDVHTELEFRRVVFGQAALDADDVFQLYQPDTEGNERLARGPPVRRTGREAPRRPRHEGSVPRQQQFRRIAGAARGATWLGGERGGTTAAASAADQTWVVIGPGRDVGRERLLHGVILRSRTK